VGDSYQADCVVAGGGLAGITCALELLDQGKSVVVLERAPQERFGGLARRSFGGLFVVDSPEQRRNGVSDSVELARSDWFAYAEFGEQDDLPRRWADAYIHHCHGELRPWLRERSVRFFPAVHWTERGLFLPGNSVPRFHIVWGTGLGLVEALVGRLEEHPRRDQLQLLFDHRVTELVREGGQIVGCAGERSGGGEFTARCGDALVLASGGIAGNLDLVREHWDRTVSEPPSEMLNGSHPEADGALLLAARGEGARLTHLEKMWHYPAGVRHWNPQFPGHGLSLVPPKSALWLDHSGRRIGQPPLVGNFDTSYLVQQVCRQAKPWTWQVLNWKIARKELAVSGAEFNAAVRDKKLLRFLGHVLLGNSALVREFVEHCDDFLTAESLDELAEKMNALTESEDVDLAAMKEVVARYDATVARAPQFHNDDQLRRIAQARLWRGDRLRTCAAAQIDDPKARPLIAIRERVVTRKSLGGLQTDLSSRVLGPAGEPLPGLYAVGEAAGFGGGGVHGRRALEGTFLGSCIFTGRTAGKAIARGTSAEDA
jgi:predicted oxidoreductase